MKNCCSIAFALSLLSLVPINAKPAKPLYEPEPRTERRVTRNLTGMYGLARKGDPNHGAVALMKIWGQEGNTFSVGIGQLLGDAAIDWKGRGVIDGDQGHYDWVFPDGKSGRTSFTVDKNGAIHGQVRGSGIDWDYVGTRVAQTKP